MTQKASCRDATFQVENVSVCWGKVPKVVGSQEAYLTNLACFVLDKCLSNLALHSSFSRPFWPSCADSATKAKNKRQVHQEVQKQKCLKLRRTLICSCANCNTSSGQDVFGQPAKENNAEQISHLGSQPQNNKLGYFTPNRLLCGCPPETRSWFVAPSVWEALPFLSVADDTGTGCSGTPFPVPPVVGSCRLSWLAWNNFRGSLLK